MHLMQQAAWEHSSSKCFAAQQTAAWSLLHIKGLKGHNTVQVVPQESSSKLQDIGGTLKLTSGR